MNSCVNRNYNNNHFIIKEYIDKEKLMSEIFNNIESKTKIIEKYKKKYYTSNNLLDSINLGKLEFLEILNDFEEIISQSLQCMRALFAEIRNLNEKKEIEDKIIKRKNNKIKNNSLNIEKSYSAYLNKCANKKENEEEDKKNKLLMDQKESMYMNIYGYKNNINNKNNLKLYYKKNTHYISKNNNSSLNNQRNYDYKSKTNTRNTLNEIKNGAKLNKNITIDSIGDKDILTYDLTLINDMGKENQNPNHSSLLINNDYNTVNNNKNKNYRKILRLELKNKEKNDININKNEKNTSMSQRYELELENTEKEKTEKIEVEVKFPIRQGIRRNCKQRIGQFDNSKSDLIDRFNYNSTKNEIIEKIKKDVKLKNYFAKKYGENKFENFLNKIWKNKLNLNEINKELKIISKTIQNEEKYQKIHSKKNNNNDNTKNNGNLFFNYN